MFMTIHAVCFQHGLLHTTKQGAVYPGEYGDQYEARDGIGQFIDYYNHRRPHQSLGYVTPHDMLTGKAQEVIGQRKKQHSLAQKERNRINRQIAKRQD